jgi:hypothetical protein
MEEGALLRLDAGGRLDPKEGSLQHLVKASRRPRGSIANSRIRLSSMRSASSSPARCELRAAVGQTFHNSVREGLRRLVQSPRGPSGWRCLEPDTAQRGPAQVRSYWSARTRAKPCFPRMKSTAICGKYVLEQMEELRKRGPKASFWRVLNFPSSSWCQIRAERNPVV